MQEHTDDILEKIDILDRSIFDNFKEEQFNEKRSISLRARKLAEHILQNQFISPIDILSEEFGKWVKGEIDETLKLLDNCITLNEMLRNDKSITSDLPQSSNCIASFRKQLAEAEKNKLRFLNQLKERTNALADKYSLHTVTRSSYIKKFIR